MPVWHKNWQMTPSWHSPAAPCQTHVHHGGLVQGHDPWSWESGQGCRPFDLDPWPFTPWPIDPWPTPTKSNMKAMLWLGINARDRDGALKTCKTLLKHWKQVDKLSWSGQPLNFYPNLILKLNKNHNLADRLWDCCGYEIDRIAILCCLLCSRRDASCFVV